MKKQLYRQGDVLIERVDKIPASAKKQKPENGRFILARGEATGHHHSFAADAADLYKDGDIQYVNCKGNTRLDGNYPVVRRFRVTVVLGVPDIGQVAVSLHDVVIDGATAAISGDFSLFQHQEHTQHAYRKGVYRHRSPQREYSPAAIRNVAD